MNFNIQSKKNLIFVYWIIILFMFLTGCSSQSSEVEYESQPRFSMASVNTIRPENIAKEVSFFGGGGGGSACSAEDNEVFVASVAPETVELRPLSKEQTGTNNIWIETCGWQTENVSASIEFPSGEKYDLTSPSTFQTGGVIDYLGDGDVVNYYASVTLYLRENPPLGKYEVTFNGGREKISHSFELVMPESPSQYFLESGDLVLWNFKPDEKITIFLYTPIEGAFLEQEYLGFEEFTADKNGNLYIDVDDNEFTNDRGLKITRTGKIVHLFAVGEDSGEPGNLLIASNILLEP